MRRPDRSGVPCSSPQPRWRRFGRLHPPSDSRPRRRVTIKLTLAKTAHDQARGGCSRDRGPCGHRRDHHRCVPRWQLQRWRASVHVSFGDAHQRCREVLGRARLRHDRAPAGRRSIAVAGRPVPRLHRRPHFRVWQNFGRPSLHGENNVDAYRNNLPASDQNPGKNSDKANNGNNNSPTTEATGKTTVIMPRWPTTTTARQTPPRTPTLTSASPLIRAIDPSEQPL